MSLQIAQVLKEKPTLPRVLQCSDLLSYFRSNQTDLTEFLTSQDNFNNLILIIHKTKDSNIIRLIYNLFTSYNTSLLKLIALSRDNVLNLISFFDSKSPNYINKSTIQNASKIKNSIGHQNIFFMISSCFDILYSAFYNWPNEMFNMLNSSIELTTLILTNVDLLPVSTFCTNLVNFSSLSQPFAWLSYRSLMGTFGPGGPTPQSFVNEPIATFKEPTISLQQRIPILSFLNSFISKYTKESIDFAKVILFALPVLLQKSSNNQERILVLELAVQLPKSESIMKCCDSILFSDCKEKRLIELSFQYLALYPPPPDPNNLEILIYDVLNRRTNNFILISFLSFFRNQMSLFEMTKTFVERARNIIIYSMKSQKSTLLLRSARIEIVNAINGKGELNSPSFQIDDFVREDIKRQRANACSSSYDTNRIKYVKEQISMNDKKSPIFDATTLWGPKSMVNKSYFTNFTSLHSKNTVTAVKRSKIENAFESVEIEDDDDLIDDNENDTNKSFSNLKTISSSRGGDVNNRSSSISSSKSNADTFLNSGAKFSPTKKCQTAKSKITAGQQQQNSNEVFKSRQLASKKKTRSILSPQRNFKSPSNLKGSEKVDNIRGRKQTEKSISTSSSTSSLSSLRKSPNQMLKINTKLPKSYLIEVAENDDENDHYDEVQSWNEREKREQMKINVNHNQNSSVAAPEKDKTDTQRLSKTPTKIRSSQSAIFHDKNASVANTPQRKAKDGKSQQMRNNVFKRNIVH